MIFTPKSVYQKGFTAPNVREGGGVIFANEVIRTMLAVGGDVEIRENIAIDP